MIRAFTFWNPHLSLYKLDSESNLVAANSFSITQVGQAVEQNQFSETKTQFQETSRFREEWGEKPSKYFNSKPNYPQTKHKHFVNFQEASITSMVTNIALMMS